MSREIGIKVKSGWGMVLVDFLLFVAVPFAFVRGVQAFDAAPHEAPVAGFVGVFGGMLILLLAIFVAKGFFILQPNEAGVLVLFGTYNGTAKDYGFWWVNPLTAKRKISLRAHNLNGDRLKVNDKAGNPIEIAAVIVWRVENTFAACFEVENYVDYVKTQSESALRHLASAYPYDSWEEGDVQAVSLRGNLDEVSHSLERELQERLERAGVKVVEARLSHLAYAPEIAGAMLQRQQASAIIAARQKIVEGAVSMVRMALEKLSVEKIVELDDERKAAMVSNLLVVLCSEKDVHPVINAGSIY